MLLFFEAQKVNNFEKVYKIWMKKQVFSYSIPGDRSIVMKDLVTRVAFSTFKSQNIEINDKMSPKFLHFYVWWM